MKRTDPFALQPEEILPTLLAMIADKGPRRWTREQKAREARRRKRRKRKRRTRLLRERVERLQAERAARGFVHRPPFGQAICHRMVAAMLPGEWYGAWDIAQLAGTYRKARGKVHQELLPRGWVERAKNPAWRGVRPPQEAARGLAEPQHVYRLTARGELVRELVRMLG